MEKADSLLPTAYVVRREGYVLTRVCPSVCPHPAPGEGGTPARSRWGGYPSQVQLGVPHLGYPHCQTWSGVPQWVPNLRYPSIRPGQEVPWQGVPHLRYPPSDLPGGMYPTSVVLDMPRSVCLVRSRRRTFLYKFMFLTILSPIK